MHESIFMPAKVDSRYMGTATSKARIIGLDKRIAICTISLLFRAEAAPIRETELHMLLDDAQVKVPCSSHSFPSYPNKYSFFTIGVVHTPRRTTQSLSPLYCVKGVRPPLSLPEISSVISHGVSVIHPSEYVD